MRIPVFARGANPRVDRPILKKSKSYADEQVVLGRAEYIHPTNPAHGIICRELLYFGPPRFEAEPNDLLNSFNLSGELRGVKFIPPSNDPRLGILAQLRAGWDWSGEQALAG